MEINEARFDNVVPIDGYGPGFFRIGGVVHEGAVLVLPRGVEEWAGFVPDPIVAAAGRIDIVLIGTGPEMSYHLPSEFRSAIEAAGIGIEVMASAQACRTYNVLLGEGRRVGAALLPT